MDYISSKHMIHMDLAARNILLGHQNIVKIADFGLTRKLHPKKDHYRIMKVMQLPIKWLALECITERIFTVKTDVWAFGIMAWEVMSYGTIPYGEATNAQMKGLIEKGVRPEKPKACSDHFYKFLKSMWYKGTFGISLSLSILFNFLKEKRRREISIHTLSLFLSLRKSLMIPISILSYNQTLRCDHRSWLYAIDLSIFEVKPNVYAHHYEMLAPFYMV